MLPIIDMIALGWFFGLWIGYTYIADRRARHSHTLMSAMRGYRHKWMERVVEREQRIIDATLAGNLSRSVTFFASTTIFILAGLLALLGATEQALVVTRELQFAVQVDAQIWAMKVLTLVVIFVYAFFKFTWSLRQFNYTSILIGCAPLPDGNAAAHREFAERAGAVLCGAAKHFNRGLRAYYFGLAALTWVLHPWLFMAATTLVVGVLYRREFHSSILRTLGVAEEVLPSQESSDS